MHYTILTVRIEYMMHKDLKNTNKKLIDTGHTLFFSESISESNHSPRTGIMLHYALIINDNYTKQ